MKSLVWGKAIGAKIFLCLFFTISIFAAFPDISHAGRNSASTYPTDPETFLTADVLGTGASSDPNNNSWSILGGISNFFLKGIVFIAGGIAIAVRWLAGILLNISGYILDATMQFSIYGLSQIVQAQSQAIFSAWTVFRDLANIAFVFVMLYIAINFILQSDSSDTKKMLSSVIIAAFLVNFSYFFTGIIIDTANQFSIMFSNGLVAEIEEGEAKTISEFIAKKTDIKKTVENVEKEFGTSNTASVNQAANQVAQKDGFTGAFNWAVGTILSLILMLVLAVVFLIAAFMLIARTIALILLLIVSPIGIAGKIHPMFEKISKEWWDSLIGNAFFLPAFLLFIVIAFKLMNTGMLSTIGQSVQGVTGSLLSTTGGTGGQSGLMQSVQTIAGGFITYTIVIGFFLAALQTAQKLSSMGSAALSKLSASITSTVGGAAMGGVGFVGRQTIGRGANKLAERIENSKFATTRLGSLALNGSRGIAGSSFDARASSAFKGVASATGVGADVLGKQGENGKKGYSGLVETAVKKRVDYASKLGSRDIKGSKEDREHEAAKDTAQKAADALLAETASSTSTPATIKLKKRDLERAKADLEIKKKAYDKAKDLKKPYIEELKKNKGLLDGKVRTWIGKANEEAAEKIEKQLKEGELDKLNKSIQAALAAAKK